MNSKCALSSLKLVKWDLQMLCSFGVVAFNILVLLIATGSGITTVFCM